MQLCLCASLLREATREVFSLRLTNGTSARDRKTSLGAQITDGTVIGTGIAKYDCAAGGKTSKQDYFALGSDLQHIWSELIQGEGSGGLRASFGRHMGYIRECCLANCMLIQIHIYKYKYTYTNTNTHIYKYNYTNANVGPPHPGE